MQNTPEICRASLQHILGKQLKSNEMPVIIQGVLSEPTSSVTLLIKNALDKVVLKNNRITWKIN